MLLEERFSLEELEELKSALVPSLLASILPSTKPLAEITVIVGMSGGVDSSVAALLLKAIGVRVIGIFMKNWDEKDESGHCTSEKDYADAKNVCQHLGIPYYSVEFIKEYWDNVFSHFLDEYKAGRTPNPDILCNKEIKFKVFYQKAMELGADYLATGHYCQNLWHDGRPKLCKAIDDQKDQTYFLYTMQEEVLKRVLFPIGHLRKAKVREYAQRFELSTFKKKDSTGICFIGERDFREFLSGYIESQKGDFITLDGEKVGRHEGACFYTIGQRKGLGLGGPGEPWYVLGKDMEANSVFVGRGHDHPALFCNGVVMRDLSWVKPDAPETFLRPGMKLKGKVRYRQEDQSLTIRSFQHTEEGFGLTVEFDSPQRAVALSQSLVLYDGDICLGGGVIAVII